LQGKAFLIWEFLGFVGVDKTSLYRNRCNW